MCVCPVPPFCSTALFDRSCSWHFYSWAWFQRGASSASDKSCIAVHAVVAAVYAEIGQAFQGGLGGSGNRTWIFDFAHPGWRSWAGMGWLRTARCGVPFDSAQPAIFRAAPHTTGSSHNWLTPVCAIACTCRGFCEQHVPATNWGGWCALQGRSAHLPQNRRCRQDETTRWYTQDVPPFARYLFKAVCHEAKD
eukprot:365694-Chlamydomonas_euryale.AAC.4